MQWLMWLSPTFQHRDVGLIPGQSEWDLWWTKWLWDRFCWSTSVLPCQCFSTKAS